MLVKSQSLVESQALDVARMAEAEMLLEIIGSGLRTDRRSAEAGLRRLGSLMGPSTPVDPARVAMPLWQQRRVIRYIDDHLASPIASQDLASLVGLSRSYFARLFKGAFGIGPRAFVIRRRVELSKALMLETTEPLCDIALAAGFADQAHMSRHFHLLVGQPPSAWRRMARAITASAAGPSRPHGAGALPTDPIPS